MLSDEELALAYDSVRSADYCNDSEQHHAALRAVAEAVVRAEREGVEPVLYQYRFQGMYGDVWRPSPVEWNGLKPVETRALYLHPPQASATVPDELTDKQVVSACYSYRHDFGLLDKDSQERIAFQCRQWWHAITKELAHPSQHPFVLAAAAGDPLPLSAHNSETPT